MSAVPTSKKRERQPASQAPARHSGERGNTPTSSFRTPRSGDPESSFSVSLETVALVPLGEVADINPRFDRDELADDMLASFVPMKCVEEESGRFVSLEDRKVGEVRKGYTAFRDGDVIFAKVTPCMENGKATVVGGLTNGIGFGSTEFFVLRPSERIDPKYLLHFVLQQSFRKEAARNMTGAVGLRRVPKSWLEQQQIPLPSIVAQRQIVAEIEKQFTRLDAGVAALRRVQANLKRYRAAVLKAACEGRLVPTEAGLTKAEGRTYETGEQLLARILADRRKNWHGRGKYKEPATPDITNLSRLPEGWVWTTVEQLNLADRPCAYGVLQPGDDIEGGVPFVRVGDISDGKVDLSNLKRITPSIAAKYPRTKLQGGELAITLVGAIGRTAIVPASLEGGNVARAVGVVPLTPQPNRHWVEIWFRNPQKVTEMTAKSHEVARKTLNLEDVRAASVALPPVAEQNRIVAEVERRLSVIEELEVAIATNFQRATRLRQSILQHAFAKESVKGVCLR